MTIVNIKFAGIDDWGRPIFKAPSGNYYVDLSCGPNNIKRTDPVAMTNYYKEHMDVLELFGSDLECDPIGGLNSNIELNIVV